MPATRSARASSTRKALADAPLGRQQAPGALPATSKQATHAATLKAAFAVTKHGSGPAAGAAKSAKAKAASPFGATKSVLHRSTAAPQIVGRESEQGVIRQFLQDTVEKGRGGSMYISGNPGTGKTACLQALIKQSAADFPSVLVNCVPLTQPGQVYAAILDALGARAGSAASALAELEALVFGRGGAFLVILDEVDSLLGSRQEVLYRLFELAARPDSCLALVGIANALDLTDRFLPRLQARNCEPLLLNFNPYQVTDIVSILQSRLDSVASGTAAEPLIQRAALELCARKVAATSGDLRKALDVCRQAMEMAECESRRKAAAPTDKENGVAAVAAAATPKVTLMHVAKALTSLNGSSAVQKLGALNFQQKLVLCGYLSLAGAAAPPTPSKKQSDTGSVGVAGLYAEYGALCKRLSMIAPVTRSEFLDLVAMMETQGVVAVDASKVGRRGGRRIAAASGAADDRAVRLAVDESDVRRALAGTPALAPLL
ncbi:AAA ATPase [Coemansia biformis]|uniref:Cell division control protein n=1 Tax=Coemansia biformis TaxID=1286918 RepID=A0A9W8CYG7_9FUNG|nr:AAA ATPase [Coemansia biformis]